MEEQVINLARRRIAFSSMEDTESEDEYIDSPLSIHFLLSFCDFWHSLNILKFLERCKDYISLYVMFTDYDIACIVWFVWNNWIEYILNCMWVLLQKKKKKKMHQKSDGQSSIAFFFLK